MIRLYNGRLIIERLKLSDNWQAKYKLPNSEQLTIDLCTPDIRQAFVRGAVSLPCSAGQAAR
jgi:hypothetical protein